MGLLIYLSIKFHDIQGQRAIPLVSIIIIIYFYAIVFRHYNELRKINMDQMKAAEQTEMEAKSGKNKECLIDLGVMDESQQQETVTNHGGSSSVFGNDDTFTQLAQRGRSVDEESGEFATVVDSDFGAPSNSTNPFRTTHVSLPTPDEVINIPKQEEPANLQDLANFVNLDVIAVDAGAPVDVEKSLDESKTSEKINDHQSDEVDLVQEPKRKKSNSKSVAHLGKDNSVSALNEPLLPATSEPKIVTSRSIPTLDNNFSPFRSKTGAAQNGAPLKIFLPRSGDDEDDDSPFTSDEEEAQNHEPNGLGNHVEL